MKNSNFNLPSYINEEQKNHCLLYRKNVKKNIIIVAMLSIIFIIISAFSYAKAVSSDLSNSVFRLHVLANSDSDEDQALKLKVRDSLLEYMNSITSNLKTKDEVICVAKNHIEDFKSIAEETIFENGYDYTVDIEIGNFEFPTKTYGDISFPAGYYDALRVKIGAAQGHNWWCVMFPPLCFVDITSGIVPEESKETLKDNLSDEDYSIISDDNNLTQFKFKIVELFKNFSVKVADK